MGRGGPKNREFEEDLFGAFVADINENVDSPTEPLEQSVADGGDAALADNSAAENKAIPIDSSDQVIAEELASILHDDWRESRRLPDGTFEPRIKDANDSEWSEKYGADQVDIANTDYKDLPRPWQAENLAAAEAAVQSIGQVGTVEEASALVHEEWLKRNGSWAPEEQKVPYDQLSEEEKAKDRAHVLKLLEISDKFSAGENGEIIPRRSELQPNIDNPLVDEIVAGGTTYRKVFVRPDSSRFSFLQEEKDLVEVWQDEEGRTIPERTIRANITFDPGSHYAGKEAPPKESLVPSAFSPAKDNKAVIVGDKKYSHIYKRPEGDGTVTSFKDMDQLWQAEDGQEISQEEMQQLINSNSNSRYLF